MFQDAMIISFAFRVSLLVHALLVYGPRCKPYCLMGLSTFVFDRVCDAPVPQGGVLGPTFRARAFSVDKVLIKC